MFVAHADWGADVKKQWVAHGRLGSDGRWRAFPPQQVAADGSLLQRLHVEPTTDPVVVGFDFPIGLPRAFAARAGIEHFPSFLAESDHGQWSDFFAVADAPEEIKLQRPFYPRSGVPKGTRRRSQLEEALGLEYAALLRRCERAQPGRTEACSLFWTLGGNQVGKGALAGWRLLRSEPPDTLSYWPFDGPLEELIGAGRVVVSETYPAEFSHHIGVGRVSGKRHQVVRRSHAEALVLFAAQAGIELDPELEQIIGDGFGPSRSGEDPFDAVIGLFGMINVVMGRRPANDPDDEAVRSVEGWILGQAALTTEVDRHRRPAAAALALTDRDPATSPDAVEVDEDDHRPMTFEEVVRKRRMIHAFQPRPVDPAVVDRLLDAARRGPSAGFSQGTDFLVVDDPVALDRFWQLTNHPEFHRHPTELAVAPPVVVLAFSDPNRYIVRYSQPDKLPFGLDHAEAWPVKFWDTDTAMACMLLLLAAVDAKLGGWLFGVSHGETELRRELGVPDDRNLIAAIGLGYPAVDERPTGSAYSLSRRPLEEMIHRNHW